MKIVNLYKYVRYDGGITVSPVKPDGEYTEMYRLIADNGKAITNGEIVTICIDVASVEGWHDAVTSDEDELTDAEVVVSVDKYPE